MDLSWLCKTYSFTYKPVNDTDNQPSVDHALAIVGYDDQLNGGCWIIANDATTKWGDQGYGAIGYNTTVDFGEAWVITKIGNVDIETTEKNFIILINNIRATYW